jgi:Zn-dependent peptidase ImmA (M78 family)/transcriptional regulator with XRE-family HTH domain
MSEAFISPPVLIWARERLKASDRQIAKTLNVKPNRLHTWETGESRPTFRQAQLLADALKIPFAFLYLKSPPVEELPLPDRRVTALRDHPTPSPDLIDVANAAKRKQDWYRDYRLSQSATLLDFVASHHMNDEPGVVAESVRAALSLSVDFYLGSKSWTDHLTRIVRAAESIGVLVFRSGIVGNNTRRTLDVSEFRGLALSDPVAPAIFVNARDAKSAQVFTMAHELAHIWIGESAATDATADMEAVENQSEIERFCDRVATELLVPGQHFIRDWPSQATVADATELLASRYRVSGTMILRRAFELDLITAEAFYRQLAVEKRRLLEHREKRKGGNFDASFTARNGRLLVESLFGSVLEGQTLYREAAAILEVKAGTLARLMSEAGLAKGA